MKVAADSEVSMAAEIARFRRFNRIYTRYLGTLKEGMHSSEFPLAEARVLYEMATREAPRSAEIAGALEMDAGYLSRILKKFEEKGLVRRKVSKRDARVAELALTAKGRAAFKKLDEGAEDQALATLRGLSSGARGELLHAMQLIERIVAPDAGPKAYVLRPHRVGDMEWVVYSEAVGYAEQFGWNSDFEGLVAEIAADFLKNYDAQRERCWMVEVDGQNVGHIFLMKHREDPTIAKLRLLYVDPSARGMGLGDVLVRECVRFARGAGYKKVMLWTQSMLTPAIKIYERAGFRLVSEQAHHSFGKDLVGQVYELEFG